jgi:hypothetical protein
MTELMWNTIEDKFLALSRDGRYHQKTWGWRGIKVMVVETPASADLPPLPLSFIKAD